MYDWDYIYGKYAVRKTKGDLRVSDITVLRGDLTYVYEKSRVTWKGEWKG